jgi:adenine-specific DNA-methyltransferase
MKNRINVSKELLRDDGFMVVTIDHCELFYLGVLADEIFGRENRLGVIAVVHNPGGRQDDKFFPTAHENMLVYAKNISVAKFEKVIIDKKIADTFDQEDKNGKYAWRSFARIRTSTLRKAKPASYYPIYVSPDLSDITLENKKGYKAIYPLSNGKEYSWKTKSNTFLKNNVDGNFSAIIIDENIHIQHKYREQQVLKNLWTDKKYFPEFQGTNLLKKLVGEGKISYPKSLYAVMDTIKIMYSKNDIILDFFGGSGTTAHAVIEANNEQGYNRKFILCEQLDEHIEVIQKRMQALFEKENLFTTSFVYCELSKCNQKYIDEALAAKTDKALTELLKRVIKTDFISYKVSPAAINENADNFEELTIEEKKQLIIELLDKNMLYVNLCDINDEDFAISEADKNFTNSFYNKGK